MSQAKSQYDTLIVIVMEKHEQIFQIMKDVDIDCWITFVRETGTNPDPVQNLVVGGDVVWESAFIFFRRGNSLEKIAIVGEGDADKERGKGLWDDVSSYVEGISSILKTKIQKLNPDKIGLNYSTEDFTADGLSYGLFLRLEEILPEYKGKFVSAQPIIQLLRSQKSPTEIKLLTRACEITEKINQKVTSQLQPGMSESEIQQIYYQEMDAYEVSEGWERVGCPAIDAGPEKEFGHVRPGSLKTKRGHTLHNDFGVQFQGYCSDLQRMWFFAPDSDIPEELKHAFETVYTAISKAAEFIKPGIKGYEVDKIARDYVVSKGL